jgi:hypothetical protein
MLVVAFTRLVVAFNRLLVAQVLLLSGEDDEESPRKRS